MRTRLVLEAATRTADGSGGATEVWNEVARVWGEVSAVSGAEVFAGDRISGHATHSIRIRYRNGVTPSQRFRSGTRVLEILSVQDPDGRRRTLICLTEERDL